VTFSWIILAQEFGEASININKESANWKMDHKWMANESWLVFLGKRVDIQLVMLSLSRVNPHQGE